MTIQQVITKQVTALQNAGIASARLDVLILLEATLQLDRARILAHPEMEILQATEEELNKKCMQRKQHLPLSYLTNQAHFHGREFYVDARVLVPRPESEAMITLLKSLHLEPGTKIADIGTGSGCLGITAALEIPGSIVTLCDISPEALAVAQQNNMAHTTGAILAATDILAGCPAPQHILLTNLPYVPNAYPINTAATHEPSVALFAGTDGLDAYRQLWQQIVRLRLKDKPIYVITESLETQHADLKALAETAGYQQKGPADGLAQLFAQSR